jgi:hypothetical protein
MGGTLGSDSRLITAGIPSAKRPRYCPQILSGTEVERLLAATDSPHDELARQGDLDHQGDACRYLQ